MSLNKFFDTNVGQDINMNIGADTIKCNSLETNNLTSTGTIEASTINVDVLNPDLILSNQILTSYTANFTATEGAIITNPRLVNQLQIGNYIELTTSATLSTPSNGSDEFFISFDKSTLLKNTPPASLGLLYRSAVSVAFGISGGEALKYNVSGQSVDISSDPNIITFQMKKDNSTTFTATTQGTLMVLVKILLP